MNTTAPVKQAVCECGHAWEFHRSLAGHPMPCDHETVTPYGLGEVPALCGCKTFKERAA